jgi:ATP-dependent DNA helicase DinG
MVTMLKQGIWRDGGALSRIVRGYEYRPQQEEFASYVEETLSAGGLLVAEAPTGVGKSLAYLVPAIDWTLAGGARLVVSTNTKNLQDQLYSQDIPKVAALLKKKLDAAVIKGRSNYVCLRRWGLLGAGQLKLGAGGVPERGLASLGAWIDSTDTGDLAEYAQGGDAALARLAEAVRVEEGLCDPARCSVGDGCFLKRLRKRASNSQVLCVNHAILIGELLGCWEILPPFDVLVIDESHNIHKVASDRLGVRFGAGAINRSIGRLVGLAGALGSGPPDGKRPVAHAAKLAEAARHAGENVEGLTGGLRAIFSSSKDARSLRYREGDERGRTVAELGGPLLDSCREVAGRLGEVVASGATAAEALEQMEAELALWGEMRRDLEHLLAPEDGHGVYWIDSTPALRWAPTDVSRQLGPAVDGACEATVLTSATLAVKKDRGDTEKDLEQTEKDFEYFTSTVGLTLENSSYPRCVRLDSPFDLERSVLCLVPRDAPDPREGSYIDFVARAVELLVERTNKKALVLFTSHSMLRSVRAKLDGRLAGELFAQGVDGERTQITNAFKRSRSGALLGTASFWEGVDFPGEEAEVLIIARLPFPVPSDPVVEGRSEALAEQGLDPFYNYQLPEAVMRLRQGFGRLIRTGADKGVAVILDPRVVRATYSRAFTRSLPVGPTIKRDIEAVAKAAAGWFSGGEE